MFLRALIACLSLPGVVAFAVPWCFVRGSEVPARPGVTAMALLCCGLSCLVWCVCAFYTSGKGTLAPWAPPRRLVTHGLYRYSRNPMYVGVTLILAGWAVLYASMALAWYAGAVAVAFHLRVVLGEEPWLARVHGPAWQRYAGTVNRWLGRRRPRLHGKA